MNFMENLKKAAVDTAQTAMEKTGKIVEKSKIKYSVYDLKNEIEKKYIQLGEAVYNSYKTDESVAEFVESICAEIERLHAKAEELKEKLD